MRASRALSLLLFALGCGYHDTPVASYHAPLPGSAGSGGMAMLPPDSAGGAGAPDALDCAPSYAISVPGARSLYRESTVGRPWVDAERDCESDGGHLVVIDDQLENDWMASIAEKTLTDSKTTNQLAWLGLGDSRVEGSFQWVTGPAVETPFWHESEPNSLYDNEDCVEVRGVGTWNDDRCDAALVYACECDETPSAARWCDTEQDTSCGDCDTVCPSDQSCDHQKCL
jgi:hypothetical protein